MKTNRLTWGVTILGLAVGLSSAAMGGQEKVRKSSEPSALPAKSALLTKKVAQAPKASVDTSLVRVADDQPGPSSKISVPLYQPPRRGAPGGRVGGGTRGPSPGLPFLYALVPDHVAVTAEEQGLLGSAYYATHPVFPRNKTVAAINMDALNTLGPMNDITIVGYGNSELDDLVEQAAGAAGRVVRSDPEPEKGYYYRSDHFSFAKEGIPALYTDSGIDHVEHGELWTREKRQEYLDNHYHKPSDEYDPAWDLNGTVDDLRLLFTVGHRLATSSAFPNWREGTEFKAKRDADRAGAE